MNIKKAKEQIKNAMTAYFAKDELGNYRIPVEKQRPVFLVGPPGIGKTAIMEQIAGELGVGLLSYSMTHHTRQSAIGLPFISHKLYDGEEYAVTEYTMSEIIASVYELMEKSGVREGILFLDEINCVSETLSPLMLQFLQYKVFGRHRVPAGWIVVTAGNPPEYNDSVREFDVVTLDRLKKIEVEPDAEVWKEYAYRAGVHPSVMTFLDIKRSFFYSVETTAEGKRFVTPRGWEDLSKMLFLYEENGLPVDEDLVIQYIQNRRIASEFAAYYDLFRKYREDYQVDRILSGDADETVKERAAAAAFDERLTLIGLLLDGAGEYVRDVIAERDVLQAVMGRLKEYRERTGGPDTGAADEAGPLSEMDAIVRSEEQALSSAENTGALPQEERIRRQRTIRLLEELSRAAAGAYGTEEAYGIMKEAYNARVRKFAVRADEAKERLSNMFRFCEEVFGEGQEILIVVTELTANDRTAEFIRRFGCDEYFRHNKELQFYERQKEIKEALEEMDL